MEMKEYKVKSIDKFQTKEWLLYKHYAKRVPPIEYSFGLFNANMHLIGVCTFGPPPRVMNNGESIFNNLSIKTIELNRLCVQSELKNILSFFVSGCLKLLPKPICVVSYADDTFGHKGYIYQATNWIYTGLNQVHERQIFYNGKEVHPRTACSMGFTSISEWANNDKNVKLGEYTKKHRYFQILGSKTFKKKAIKKLIYPIIEYPKGESIRYDSSYSPTIQSQLF